ncbi:SprT-like domain-containing protein [Thalassiella azotivora]
MDLEEARRMATALMRGHGLDDWTLVYDRARTRAGICRPARREIGLSRALTALHPPEEVRDTVLHEIAHALVGTDHGHDEVWRRAAVAIGCSGRRCVDRGSPRPDAPWQGTCPAGHVAHRYRVPQRVQSCRRCSPSFDPRHLLRWTRLGEVVPMHPRYAAELRRLERAGPPPTADAPAADRPRRRPALLPVGALVTVGGTGRHAGTRGLVEKVARTRYHVRTREGLLTVPFDLARASGPLGSAARPAARPSAPG